MFTFQVTKTLFTIIFAYLVSWLPYAVKYLPSTNLRIFSLPQVSCLVSMLSPTPPPPLASAACLLFAKSSVCWNPIIYLILNPQVTAVVQPILTVVSVQFQTEFQAVFGVRVPDFIRVRSSRRRPGHRRSKQVWGHTATASTCSCTHKIYLSL